MLQQINWTEWFSNHPNNKDDNRNMAAFSSILEAGFSEEEKLQSLVEEIDTVILLQFPNQLISSIFLKKLGRSPLRGERSLACFFVPDLRRIT